MCDINARSARPSKKTQIQFSWRGWIPDTHGLVEMPSFNNSTSDMKTLEKIGAIVTLAKAAAMSDSADDARAYSEKLFPDVVTMVRQKIRIQQKMVKA